MALGEGSLAQALQQRQDEEQAKEEREKRFLELYTQVPYLDNLISTAANPNNAVVINHDWTYYHTQPLELSQEMKALIDEAIGLVPPDKWISPPYPINASMVSVTEPSYISPESRKKKPRFVSLTVSCMSKCLWPDGTIHLAMGGFSNSKHVPKTSGFFGSSNLDKEVSQMVEDANKALEKFYRLKNGSQEYVKFTYCHDPYAWKEDRDPDCCDLVIFKDGVVFDTDPPGSASSNRHYYKPLPLDDPSQMKEFLVSRLEGLIKR